MSALDRRETLRALVALAAGAATPVAAQEADRFEAFFRGCRELSGFETLPRRLARALFDALAAEDRAAGEKADEGRVLQALYTGILPPRGEEGAPARLVFGDALMWAAVEDWKNVFTFCGGPPNFWTEPPEPKL